MACSQTLTSYTIGDCFTSSGGIKKAWIGNYVDNAFTIDSAGTVTGFASGVTWYSQELRKQTGSLTSTYNYDESNGSSYVSTEAVIEYTRMNMENRLQANALIKGDFIMVLQDANNQYYALGTESPVHSTAGSGESGVNRSDKNAYVLTLTDESSVFPPMLSSTAISLLP